MEKIALTEEQKEFLEENFRTMKEQELFQKLSELGPKVDEAALRDMIQAVTAKAEDAVFSYAVSEEELAQTDGGMSGLNGSTAEKNGDWNNNCKEMTWRNIYEGGFPNCAKTVKEGSWCSRKNDACNLFSVIYQGMTACEKVWR